MIWEDLTSKFESEKQKLENTLGEVGSFVESEKQKLENTLGEVGSFVEGEKQKAETELKKAGNFIDEVVKVGVADLDTHKQVVASALDGNLEQAFNITKENLDKTLEVGKLILEGHGDEAKDKIHEQWDAKVKHGEEVLRKLTDPEQFASIAKEQTQIIKKLIALIPKTQNIVSESLESLLIVSNFFEGTLYITKDIHEKFGICRSFIKIILAYFGQIDIIAVMDLGTAGLNAAITGMQIANYGFKSSVLIGKELVNSEVVSKLLIDIQKIITTLDILEGFFDDPEQSDVVQEIVDSNVVQEVANSDVVQEVVNSEVVQAIANSDVVQEIANSDVVQAIVNSDVGQKVITTVDSCVKRLLEEGGGDVSKVEGELVITWVIEKFILGSNDES